MPHRAIRTALAVGLAATSLTIPAAAPPATTQPPVVETAPAGIPAVTLLGGAAPTTVTRGEAAAIPAALALGARPCHGHPVADGGPTPCPAQPDWTSTQTFAIVKQPHPSVDQHATPAGGPSAPALLLLDHMRPRSALPTGRTTRLDPRPA